MLPQKIVEHGADFRYVVGDSEVRRVPESVAKGHLDHISLQKHAPLDVIAIGVEGLSCLWYTFPAEVLAEQGPSRQLPSAFFVETSKILDEVAGVKPVLAMLGTIVIPEQFDKRI